MNICQECRKSQSSIKSKLAPKRKAIGKLVLSEFPLSQFSKQLLAVAVHTLLEKQRKLEVRVNQLGNKISTQGLTLGDFLHSDWLIMLQLLHKKCRFKTFSGKNRKNILVQQVKG